MLTCLPMKPGELWGKDPRMAFRFLLSWNLTQAGRKGHSQSPGSSPLLEARCSRDPETGCVSSCSGDRVLGSHPCSHLETCRSGYCSLNIFTFVCFVAQSCPTLCDPMDYNPPGSVVHGDFPGKNTGVGCHALLQGNFPTQGWNPGIQHHRWILYHLCHQGSPWILEWVAYPFSRRSSQNRKGSLPAELPGKPPHTGRREKAGFSILLPGI